MECWYWSAKDDDAVTPLQGEMKAVMMPHQWSNFHASSVPLSST
jgi:hypothetical protein